MTDTVVPPLPLGRDTMFWHVAGHHAHVLGSRRALLLQVAHPAVAAAVDRHSPYATDPWGRLVTTMGTVTRLCFGTEAQSRDAAGFLRRIHRPVAGHDARGCPYRASDPTLGLWVWATLVDSAYRAFELVRGPLAAPGLESFYAGARAFAAGCGVPPEMHPPHWEAFTDYVEDVVAHDLDVTDAAHTVAHVTAVVPVPGPLAPASARVVHLCTAGLLDERLRVAYGFGWTDRDARAFGHLVEVLRRIDALAPARVPYAVSTLAMALPVPGAPGRLRTAGGRVASTRRAGATRHHRAR